MIFFRERGIKPRFALTSTFEYTAAIKWKQLELQEKELLEDVKSRIQIDQMMLEQSAPMKNNCKISGNKIFHLLFKISNTYNRKTRKDICINRHVVKLYEMQY
jgi:AAA+ ATPase superfamily predicted ATPase